MNLIIPGNTKAQVCLPRYIFPHIPAHVPCNVRYDHGGFYSNSSGALLCLDDDLGGGTYNLEVVC